jgi:8-amino-7-oxononanoate synthase
MPDIFAQVITFGKALGTYGAIVLGSALLKRALVNFATSFIYTTALPFYMLAAIQCSYAIFPNMEKERQHLEQLIYRISKTPFQASGTHIQALSIPGNAAVKEVSQALSKNGFDIRPLMSPTVQKGHEILRLSLHAFNTEKELFELFNLIRTLGIYV